MNILILGATGRVGSLIMNEALNDGHGVTAFVRRPERRPIEHDHLTIFQGNVLNKEDVAQAIKGIDVVVSALNTDGGTTLSDSMPHIIAAMENEGIRRIITVGTAGILQSRTSPHLLRYQSSESKRKSTRAAEDHHQAYEILKQSALDWTIVCPTYLPDGERVGHYRVEKDFLPVDGVKIHTADTAAFTYEQIKNDRYIRARVGIAY